MPGPVAGPPAPDRPWAGRFLDLERLVAAHDPGAAPPWVVEPLIITGTLAVVAGKGGAGKTWIMHEAADAVQRGRSRAGLRGTAGRAMIIDAEMGSWLTVDRFASQGYSTDVTVFDAQGLDLSQPEGRELVWGAMSEVRPTFVGIDSLKALTPGGKENDSDDMGPVVNWLRVAINKLGAAGLLVHHAGWKEDRTRGSSAIKDRVDAVWYLGAAEEPGDPQRLSCHGADLKAPRWSRPPDDMWLRLRPEGGFETTDRPTHAEATPEIEDRIVALLENQPEFYASHDQIAEALGRARATARIKSVIERRAVKVGKWYRLKDGDTDEPAI